MENSFFPKTWRRDVNKLLSDSEYRSLPVGKAQVLLIKRQLIESVIRFIEEIFHYTSVDITHTFEQIDDDDPTGGYSTGLFYEKNTCFRFGVRMFKELHSFHIKNIPVLEETRHIEVLFNSIEDFLRHYYNLINDYYYANTQNDHITASESFRFIADGIINNFNEMILKEYLFQLFNYFDSDYRNDFTMGPKPIRYDMDLINTIFRFSNLLANSKIENKEVYTGFVFHNNLDDLKLNSKKIIQIKESIEFGDFNKLKSLIQITNGQDIFFNVTNNKITDVFITKEKIQEVALEVTNEGKIFINRPFIVSIQGSGKFSFLEGRNDRNRILLQLVNGKYQIKDHKYIRRHIKEFLLDQNLEKSKSEIDVFINWILSLSLKNIGTSLILGDFSDVITKKLVKSTKINYPHNLFDDININYDINLLNKFIEPDGAIIFNKKLNPFIISSILPIKKNSDYSVGGARHNSVKMFTEQEKCIGIVISEDGPISIFENGTRIAKY